MVLMNSWSGRFYDAIQNLDKVKFIEMALQFFLIVTLLISIHLSKYFTQATLAFKWRIWLTQQVMNEWLHNSTFCRLFIYKTKTENPDQRISQDLATFTTSSLFLIITIIAETIKSVIFAIILWKLSTTFLIPLPGGDELHIPGYMLWITIIYVTFSTGIIYKFGKPLVALDYTQEKVEADFRFGLMRIRDRREEVSLLDGAKAEIKFLGQNILNIIKNYKQIIRCNMYIISFQNLFVNFSTLLPVLAASPMFFSGAITLGTLQQVVNAFNRVEGALMTFSTSFQDFASWLATFERIVDFRAEMKQINEISQEKNSELNLNISNANHILEVTDLTLFLPEKKTLSKFNFKIAPQEKVLMMGRSGLGKSTLLKCIAGYWPYASGQIIRPHALTIVAQKPYFPISTLHDSLLYPNLELNVSELEIKRVLEECSLGDLSNRIYEVNDWNAILSVGEQQRLNFARIILAKPSWLVLDEPTSAIDKALEKKLFAALFTELPAVSLLTIGHSLSLKDFHTRCIEV